MGVDTPYREGRLKQQLRKRYASKESRAGLPKELCRRERRIVQLLCIPAAPSLLGVGFLSEMGRPLPLWIQSVCMIQCLFWCALAGLYETASDWQRGAANRNVKIERLLEGVGGLSEQDAIAIADEAARFGFATGEDVAEALRTELGGE